MPLRVPLSALYYHCLLHKALKALKIELLFYSSFKVIYLCLAVLGLHCCVGYSLVVFRLLIAVASLVNHGI